MLERTQQHDESWNGSLRVSLPSSSLSHLKFPDLFTFLVPPYDSVVRAYSLFLSSFLSASLSLLRVCLLARSAFLSVRLSPDQHTDAALARAPTGQLAVVGE